MVDGRAGNGFLKDVVGEDADLVAVVQDLADDLLGEFRVALDGEVAARGVEALDGAGVVGSEELGAFGDGEDGVGVHLLDGLDVVLEQRVRWSGGC